VGVGERQGGSGTYWFSLVQWGWVSCTLPASACTEPFWEPKEVWTVDAGAAEHLSLLLSCPSLPVVRSWSVKRTSPELRGTSWRLPSRSETNHKRHLSRWTRKFRCGVYKLDPSFMTSYIISHQNHRQIQGHRASSAP